MTLVAGIDGGQSATVAVIGDGAGRILGRGSAGPADEVGESASSTRLRDALAHALHAARSAAGLPEATRYAAIVAGISGYDETLRGRAPDLPADRVELLHDAPIAHAGALGGAPGVVVIAGTGSVVYAAGGEHPQTRGGWGFVFGDEGSAFGVVREGLAELMRREDADGPAGEEVREATAFFALPSLRAITQAFYAGELSRARLAAFAPVALQLPVFQATAQRGADRLIGLVKAALKSGAPPVVACAGGMFADDGFARYFVRELAREVPQAVPARSRYDPATGALLLAYRLAGLGPFEALEGT